MNRWRRSLSLRLALAFALVSLLVLGGIGLYLYRSLQQEIAWRDDQTLLGRLDRMANLLRDAADIQALRARPELYANMLGNTEHFLWVLDSSGTVLISINPRELPLPDLHAGPEPHFQEGSGEPSYRLVTQQSRIHGQTLTLVAGHLLSERENMLAAYRTNLVLALLCASLLSFVLAALISRRGLLPLRQLAAQAAELDTARLHTRLHTGSTYAELDGLEHNLNQALTRIDEGYQQLMRFSADLAHEMRTPLNNLIGQTQQVLSKARSVYRYEQVLESNLEEFERLARMIDSLLFLARSEHPTTAVRRQTVDLHDLTARLCDYFEDMAEEHGLRLQNHCQGSLQADPEMLTRALANLIANAIRHADTGSDITISSAHSEGQCVLAVTNRGAHIEQPHLAHLFDRFYRADPSRSAPGSTGGLGLAIVQAIMRQHGGYASVTNEDDGVRFELVFPHTTT